MERKGSNGTSNDTSNGLQMVLKFDRESVIKNSQSLELFHNFKAVVHVPCTLGCLVTCLVFSFTTFLPSEFLNLVAHSSTSSGVIFLTQTVLSFLFPAGCENIRKGN